MRCDHTQPRARTALNTSTSATAICVRVDIVCQIIWAKSQFVIGRGDYHWQHEPCWYAVRRGENHNWQGARDQSTLWEIPLKNPEEQIEGGHSTQKPVECMQRPMENNTKAGDLVYDPFCGSGTTIIAAERTGRICRAIELEPSYVAVALERFKEATGKVPTLLK